MKKHRKISIEELKFLLKRNKLKDNGVYHLSETGLMNRYEKHLENEYGEIVDIGPIDFPLVEALKSLDYDVFWDSFIYFLNCEVEKGELFSYDDDLTYLYDTDRALNKLGKKVGMYYTLKKWRYKNG